MGWKTSSALPEMLVRTRRFVSSARWWCIIVWNGLDDDHSREWEFLVTGRTEDEAISKAADELRQLAR